MEAKKENNFIGALPLIGLIVGFVYLLFQCNGNDAPRDLKYDAEVQAESFVTEKLKSPSTAEFGFANVTDLGNDEYEVTSYVDSQNSFGGIVRTDYSCKVKFTESGTKYIIEDLEMNQH